MPDRVLIIYMSAGAGHMRAAQAIEKQYAITGGASEVRCVDILDFSNRLYTWLQRDGYVRLVNKIPALFGLLYDYFDRPGKSRGRFFDRLCTAPLLKMAQDFQPDVIISTHGVIATLVSGWLERRLVRARHGIVVTDVDAHAAWLCPNYSCYFVSSYVTRRYLRHCGIDPECIEVSGIPIDPVFAQRKDRQALLSSYGLDASRPLILVSGGGFGMGPVEEIAESLLGLQHPAQVVVLCGRNQKLASKINSIAVSSIVPADLVSLQAVGYTDKVDEYMTMATLIVGKPGGLFTSEALAKSCVFVIVRPISGQESRNSDYLLESGVAIRCNDLPVLQYKVDELLDNPRRLARMREDAYQLSYPAAAKAVVSRMSPPY